jgi:hypothetical protein
MNQKAIIIMTNVTIKTLDSSLLSMEATTEQNRKIFALKLISFLSFAFNGFLMTYISLTIPQIP